MICANCGKENKGGRFCIGCGSVLQIETHHYCRNCEEEVAAKRFFVFIAGPYQKRENVTTRTVAHQQMRPRKYASNVV